MTILRPLLSIALFVVGIGAGVLAYQRFTAVDIDYGPYPPKGEAAEPAAADRFTDLLLDGDDRTLAEEFSEDALAQLGGALRLGTTPMVEVRDVRYLGSVTEGTDTLASYVALGTFNDGSEGVLTFAVRVQNGTVVGVN